MKKTWMLRTAGILCIIGGTIIAAPAAMMVAESLGPAPSHADPGGYIVMIFFGVPSIILGTVAIVGGIYALKRRVWVLALTGSIVIAIPGSLLIFTGANLIGSCILGILAIIFVIVGKGEFKAKALVVDISPKSRRSTALLAFFLGVFGAHRFYIGKTRTALVMLLLSIAGWAAMVGFRSYELDIAGGLVVIAVWIWAFIDFIVAVTGDMTDKEGRLIKK